MNEDIVPELLETIVRDFEQALESSQVVNECLTALAAKEATYETANAYAIEIGRILSEALGASITSQNLPDGKMYYNIAKRVLEDRLGANHELVVNFSSSVQQLLNENAGIGLQVRVPELNRDKISGLVNRLSHGEQFEDVKWLLGDPIVTFSQGIIDDMIQENVKFHAEVGLSPKVTRRHVGNCCDWCRGLSGTYEYPRVPKDVYRRHGNCRCQTDYRTVDGKVQNVWTKIWKKIQNRDKMGERKNLNLEQGMSVVRAEALKRGIETNRIKKSLVKKSELAIIKAVGGGDLTQGSCSSLAFAYIGNKAGYDVLDYRDGESRKLFASNQIIMDIAKLPHVDSIIVRDKNDYSAVNKLLPYMEDGKEYYLATGRHAAIIRKTTGRYEYLELQDPTDNGFKPFSNIVLKNRFACQKSYSSYGQKFEVPSILIEAESLGKHEEFQKILPFIHTPKSKQVKGERGYVR